MLRRNLVRTTDVRTLLIMGIVSNIKRLQMNPEISIENGSISTIQRAGRDSGACSLPVNRGAQSVCARTSEPEAEVPAEVQSAWEQALRAVKGKMRKSEFDTWILPLKVISFEGDQYQIRACNPVAGQWVIDHAAVLLQEALGNAVVIIWDGKR